MKRHKSLIPLSHDHHHGLLVAQLCKKDAPPYQGLPQDAKGKAAYALNAWDNEISVHFKNEEEILFPFVKGKNDAIDKLISEILIEHGKIESHFNKIRIGKDLTDNLDTLGKDLEAHIRKEERILFKLIQEEFGDKLDQLEDKIQPAKDVSCKS